MEYYTAIEKKELLICMDESQKAYCRANVARPKKLWKAFVLFLCVFISSLRAETISL